MDCTLATLIACFSWSGLYIDSGLLYQDGGEHFTTFETASTVIIDDGLIETAAAKSMRSIDSAKNPYGRISLGYQMQLESVEWRIELSHLSSVSTNIDRGINSVSLNVRWFPFR